jgi:hypothetical protein
MKGRKKKVLIEKSNEEFKKILPSRHLTGFSSLTFSAGEIIHSNRFVVELEMENGIIIDPSRIQGYSIKLVDSKKELLITTTISTEEWVSEFQSVIMARIFIIDAYGNDIHMFDFDVSTGGYIVSGSYDNTSFLKPTFVYKIIE